MKSTLFFINIAAQSTWAIHSQQRSVNDWTAPDSDDLRGPCPMMNTLANHGYINHDGRNITAEGLVNGLVNGLNFDPTLAAGLFAQVIVANPEPNATYFTLEQIREHGVLEHDASLSRADAYFGDNYSFNESVFAESTSFWSGDVLDANALAMSKVGRQVSSKAHNPTYRWTASVENAGVFEVGGIIIALGDLATSTVEKSYVEYFFRNERLPSELGWTVKTDPITAEDVAAQVLAITVAQNLTTAD